MSGTIGGDGRMLNSDVNVPLPKTRDSIKVARSDHLGPVFRARHPLGLIAQRQERVAVPGPRHTGSLRDRSRKTEIEYLFHPKYGPALGVGFSTWRGPCRPPPGRN